MTKKHRESSSSSTCHPKKEFEHKIQLQLSDSLGFPVAGTEFWITLPLSKKDESDHSVPDHQLPNRTVGPNNPAEPLGDLFQGGISILRMDFYQRNCALMI